MTSYDLQIVQGATFNLTLTLSDDDGSPLDLTTYQLSGYVRNGYGATGILANLNASILTPTSGIISLSIPASGTAQMPVTIGVYDISILETQSQTASKALYGNVYIYPEVTY